MSGPGEHQGRVSLSNSVLRIRRAMRNPGVQTVLEQYGPRPVPAGQSVPRPPVPQTSTLSLLPAAGVADVVPSISSIARRTDSGVGITRLLCSRPVSSSSSSQFSSPSCSASRPVQSYRHVFQSTSSGPSSSSANSHPPIEQHQLQQPQDLGSPTPYQLPQRYQPSVSYIDSARTMTRRRKVPYRRKDTAQGRWYTKSVVMVDDDDVNVPRGKRRQVLHEMGAVADLVDFNTTWNEQQVREAVENVFQGMIDGENSSSPKFDFLKVGGKLLKPNVDPRSEWTGDKVRQISGHGDVYIRPTFSIKLELKTDFDHVEADGEHLLPASNLGGSEVTNSASNMMTQQSGRAKEPESEEDNGDSVVLVSLSKEQPSSSSKGAMLDSSGASSSKEDDPVETIKLILGDSYSTAEIHAALTMNLWNVHDAIDSLLDTQVSEKAKSYTGSPNSALEDIMYDHSKRVLTHKWQQL